MATYYDKVIKPFSVGNVKFDVNDRSPFSTKAKRDSKLRTRHIRPMTESEIREYKRKRGHLEKKVQPGPDQGGKQSGPKTDGQPGPTQTPTNPPKEIKVEVEGEEVSFVLDAEALANAHALHDVSPDNFNELMSAIAALGFPGKNAKGNAATLKQKREDILAILAPYLG